MNKIKIGILLSIFLFPPSLQGAQPTQPAKPPVPGMQLQETIPPQLRKLTISIINTNNPSQGNISSTTNSSSDTAVSQSAQQRAQQTATQNTDIRIKQTLVTKIKTFSSSISLDYYKKKATGAYKASGQWITDHRFHLLIAASIISYATLCYLANSGFNYFKDTTLWASWKREYSLERLLSLPQEQLTQELIVSIQTRYINSENPTDCIQPLIHFVRDIDREIKNLRWYRSYFVWLGRLYLSRITFIQSDYVTDIQHKLERLAYIKQLFGQWLAQQNLVHAFDQPHSRSFYERITRSVKNVFRSSTKNIYSKYRSLVGCVPAAR